METRVERVRNERQPQPDLGNGYYRNPILAGKYSDPSIVRVGEDFYITHSGGGAPGLLLWHSRDLVNWRPIGKALGTYVGDVWAPDLIYHDDLFYIYVTIAQRASDGTFSFSNVVLQAERPEGPWSEPVDLHIDGLIDPGHVADQDGRRYLYLEKGWVVPLTPDGRRTAGELQQVYAGWRYPEEWVVECFCLESPKFTYRDGYFYLLSAQGGTAGPATSHMTVVARSTSPLGPWENSPYNPVLRTRSRDERWWSQGHGSLIDDVAGAWWILYHAYENGQRGLGRQTMLLPVEWTADGWPRIKSGHTAADIIAKPAGEDVGHGMPLSDDFTDRDLGLQWRCWDKGDPYRIYRPGDGALHIRTKGTDVTNAARLACHPVNHAYEVRVELNRTESAEIGLALHNDFRDEYHGVGLNDDELIIYWRSRRFSGVPCTGERVFLKLWNLNDDVVLFYSADGESWHKFGRSLEVSAGYGRLRVCLYAAGKGEGVFRDFRYHGLD
jgi:xylan 1,4-beta-xylosidase